MLLKSVVKTDQITGQISAAFDYVFDGVTQTEVPDLIAVPETFDIGLLVGPSGSGKTSLLKQFGSADTPIWSPDRAVASHFLDADDAIAKLSAAGLMSIPSWLRPYQVLSTGERFRADVARRLRSGAVFDEFTSTVDRTVAASCSRAMARHIRSAGLTQVVVASCHYDIEAWLEPDWVYDLQTRTLHTSRRLERPSIEVDVIPCSAEAWGIFAPHHYLSGALNPSARCWMAIWEGRLVGFTSVLAFPNGNFSEAWREHRTVVLPDYQGMGIGVRLADCVAQQFVDAGGRFFSKTAHPRMGEYRERSIKWRPTSKNRKSRADYLTGVTVTKEDGHKAAHANRVTYSHEYVGAPR